MEYTYMGKTGMKISRLCLGTMNFGPNTEEKEAFRIMDCALDLGINFFDTANMYGGRNGGKRGWTEEIIGRWFVQGGGRRERVVLATKVFEPMDNELDGPNDEPGLSAYKIRRHLEAVGLLHRFQKLCSGHDIPNGKPAPDIYLLGAKELGLAPEECLALEDSPTGILSAYRAGCLPVMIPDLDQPKEDTQKLLFAKADSLADIIDILKKQNGHR